MTLPGTNGPMRTWLRSRISTVSNRVYFSVPQKDAPTLPFLVFYRVGGLPDNQQHDNPDFIIECWAENLKLSEDLAREVASSILDAEDEAPLLCDGVKVIASGVNGVVPSSGVTGAKRYRVDCSMRMRSA